MVGKKRYRSKKFKKNAHYKRAAIKKEAKPIICYSPSVCPDVMRVQLPYHVTKLAAGGGVFTISDNVFRANGMFDPDFAVGGAQPLGFDQWSTLYRRYRVRGVKVIVQGNADGASNCGFGISFSNTSSLFTDKDQAIESNYAVNMEIGGDASNGVGKLEKYMTIAQIRGNPPDIVDYETDLSALISANVVQQVFLHVFGYGSGAAASNFEINLNIKIVFHCDFYDRETLARS